MSKCTLFFSITLFNCWHAAYALPEYVNKGLLTDSKACLNPNGNIGVCISINDCEPLKNILLERITKHYDFVRKCQCAGFSGKYPNVCCTQDTQPLEEERLERIIFPDELLKSKYTIKQQKAKVMPTARQSKFPNRCGQNDVIDRILGGAIAYLTEFSWVVALEYRTVLGALVLDCAGSLIHERYTLTAAHCVRGNIEIKVGNLESVRVGDYNTETEDDCNEHGCVPRFQRIGIEHIIIHEHYNAVKSDKSHQRHDIALLRLQRPVQFTEFLKPICLPIDTNGELLKAQTNLTVAGWGHTGYSKRSAELRKVVVPLVNQTKCHQIFAEQFDLSQEQLCAGGNFREDSCSGDSGGPLMRLNKNYNWVLEGIVSFGTGCGLEHRPAIYTRVRSYLDWLDQHII